MLEDQILWWRSKRGSRRAFDLIYQKYVDMMLTVALHLLGNAGDAEDVVQDVFTSLVEAPQTLELHGSLKGFLAVCVANKSRDLLRRRKLAPAGRDDRGGRRMVMSRSKWSFAASKSCGCARRWAGCLTSSRK